MHPTQRSESTVAHNAHNLASPPWRPEIKAWGQIYAAGGINERQSMVGSQNKVRWGHVFPASW
jgi:hypothetical protein